MQRTLTRVSAPSTRRCLHRRWHRVMILGIALACGILVLDVFAPPDVVVGMLYSVVVLVLSFTRYRAVVVTGALGSLGLILIGAALWPPGVSLVESAPNLVMSASLVCLVAGILLHRIRIEEQRDAAGREREEALRQIKILQGLLPICAWCKRIRDGEAQWVPLEEYISSHSEAGFTHGICPECSQERCGVTIGRTR